MLPISKYIKQPSRILLGLISHGYLEWLGNKNLVRILYKLQTGQTLNLDNPQTFNEKIQWLKVYDHNPLYTTLVDKQAVKGWVADKIGKEYVIPTLGVWNSFDEIDFDTLPSQFVLKCTHDSGSVCICQDKNTFDKQAAKIQLTQALKRSGHWYGREWPYKNVPHKIIAEKYMIDTKTQELRDYKFFCFNGEPKMLFVASDRQNPNEETKFDFYDLDFKHLPFTNGHPNSRKSIEKPHAFEEMKNLARTLSQNIPHVRVDFYEINGQIYFGELTFSHYSGFVPFEPAEWDKKIGDWLKLPAKEL